MGQRGAEVPGDLRVLIGLTAIVSSTRYIISDVTELAAGRLYTAQLIVTYLAEASIPIAIYNVNAVLALMGAACLVATPARSR